jgi:hypothetical protein
MKSLDWASHEIFERSARTERANQIHLATYVMKPHGFQKRGIEMTQNADSARIMRSVLMKPEQEDWIPDLHMHVESLAKQLIEEKR